jgi:PAS domain S-box-containing protein
VHELTLLLERSPEPLLLVDAATRQITQANPAAAGFFGLELTGQPLAALGPELAAALAAGRTGPLTVVAAGRALEATLVDLDGPVLVTLRPAVPGQLQRLLGTLFDHLPSAIAYRAPDGTLRWANRTHERLTGVPAAELVGKDPARTFSTGALDDFLGLVQRVVATREPVQVQARPFRHVVNGQEHVTTWDVSYIPVFADDGVLEGVLSLGTEVTERMERERLLRRQMGELEAADRYKDEFLSVVSHELRTPLNFIMGFASTLADEVLGPLEAPQHQALDRILAGSDRMLLLVNDLLDFAKLQSGRFELVRERARLAPLVREVLAQLAPLALQKDLALTTEVPEQLEADLDPGRIIQVLTNLVDNAIKFTPAGGRVVVRARLEAGELYVEVADTGRGIADEDLPRLFARFQQVDMSATRETGGTGLGLAICKALVEAHGGQIGVQSQPGLGSTFWFRLPA